MWTTEIPTEPGAYYWRDQKGKPWTVRILAMDSLGLYCVGSRAIALPFIGGEWQKVPPPQD